MRTSNYQASHRSGTICCPVVEPRQDLTLPGGRERLIQTFEQRLLESQEAESVHLIGHHRMDGEPDHFTWLRGFPSMTGRRRSLEAFQHGPVWRACRNEGNTTVRDSDDVLLLRPIRPPGGRHAVTPLFRRHTSSLRPPGCGVPAVLTIP